MKRAKGPGRVRWFLDYETQNWDEPVCAVAMSEHGDVERFVGAKAAAQVADFQDHARGIWWAHAGGIFDHPLTWRFGKAPREVILTGSAVLSATALKSEHTRGQLIYRDSYPRTLSSLEKIGKAVGLPKLDVDRGAIEKLSVGEALAYCERDVEILRKGVLELDAWLESYGVKASTSGSAAVKLMGAMDPRTALALQDHLVEPELALGVTPEDGLPPRGPWKTEASRVSWGMERDRSVGALEAVRGGRVETRRIGRVEGPLYVYDIHSSYPSRYGEGRVPIGLQEDDGTDIEQWGWVDWVTWESFPRDGQTAFELGFLGHGRGHLGAWCTWETAWELEKRGLRPRRHGIGWKGTASVGDFARAFVAELYRLKEGNTPAKFWAKVHFNSLSGKLGEKPRRVRYELRPEYHGKSTAELPDHWRRAYDAVAAFCRVEPHQQPLAAATILQRARLAMAKAIEAVEAAGWEFYYCDTDSLITNCPPEKMASIIPMGPGLGQWGHEFTAPWGIFLAPKTYYLAPPDEKGFPKKAAKGIDRDKATQEAFEAALAHADGVKLARGGLHKFRQGNKAGTAADITRTMRPVHFGRRLDSSGRLIYE